MPIKLIGRKTNFKGKTLWEILGNLKNYGVGRLIIRNVFQRYPEPTYFKVLKVGALPNEDPRKVMVLVEKVFRGIKAEKIVQIDTVSYKADYQLVHKDQEYKYQPTQEAKVAVFPRTMEFPPLLQELMARKLHAKGITQKPEMKIWYNLKGNSAKQYRPAEEGETPTQEFRIGLGEPSSPSLYSNIKPI